LSGGDADRKFSRSMFRATFDLEATPAGAPARITADSRYVLWVNGHEVGRGPARSQPYRQRYDSYDLAPRLSIGTNVIAVLVIYYGRPMSFWQPAPAGSNTYAALVFEAQIGSRTLASDDSWRVRRSSAWSLLSGTDAGKVCRSKLSTPGKSRTDGRKSTLTTPTGSTHLCFRPSTRAVSGRHGPRRTPSADCSPVGSHSWR
jgi:hypothetical protein